MAIMIGLLGILSLNPIPVMIAAFVFLAGAAEEQMVRGEMAAPLRYDSRVVHESTGTAPDSTAGSQVVTGELLWPNDPRAPRYPHQTMRTHFVTRPVVVRPRASISLRRCCYGPECATQVL